MKELTVGKVPQTSQKKSNPSSVIAFIISLGFFFFCASKNQSQFKSKGTKLIPDCPNELALMYQRMFEGFTLTQKSGMSTKRVAFHKKKQKNVLATC